MPGDLHPNWIFNGVSVGASTIKKILSFKWTVRGFSFCWRRVVNILPIKMGTRSDSRAGLWFSLSWIFYMPSPGVDGFYCYVFLGFRSAWMDTYRDFLVWLFHGVRILDRSVWLCIVSVSLCDGGSATTACLFFSVSAVSVPRWHWRPL